MLQELLKKYLADDGKVAEFLKEMKTNKIYLSKEENIDTRFEKLKGDYDTRNAEYENAKNLIEELKQTNAGNEALQGKVTQYEQTIATLQAEKAEMEKDNAIKMMLLSNNAKAEDIDYLMFKIKQGDYGVKFDDKNAITNAKDIAEALSKALPNHFEASAKKVVDVNKLPDDEGKKNAMTKQEFLKKPYPERAKFAEENPEAFNALMEE